MPEVSPGADSARPGVVPEHTQALGRSARKRKSIIEAATELFLRNGYQGTSMDELAAMAAVSKQTVYKNFADKQQLFNAVMLDQTDQGGALFDDLTGPLRETADLEGDLRALARRYISFVIQPRVLRLRWLLIAEADRFPELAQTYYQRGPDHVVAAVADSFRHLADRGLLQLDDPLVAARQFAFLVLAIPLDRAMFHRGESTFTPEELETIADDGVRVFLAAYRKH